MKNKPEIIRRPLKQRRFSVDSAFYSHRMLLAYVQGVTNVRGFEKWLELEPEWRVEKVSGEKFFWAQRGTAKSADYARVKIQFLKHSPEDLFAQKLDIEATPFLMTSDDGYSYVQFAKHMSSRTNGAIAHFGSIKLGGLFEALREVGKAKEIQLTMAAGRVPVKGLGTIVVYSKDNELENSTFWITLERVRVPFTPTYMRIRLHGKSAQIHIDAFGNVMFVAKKEVVIRPEDGSDLFEILARDGFIVRTRSNPAERIEEIPGIR